MTNTIQIDNLIEKLQEVTNCLSRISGDYPPLAERGATPILRIPSDDLDVTSYDFDLPYGVTSVMQFDAIDINVRIGDEEIGFHQFIYLDALSNFDETDEYGTMLMDGHTAVKIHNESFDITALNENATLVNIMGIKL